MNKSILSLFVFAIVLIFLQVIVFDNILFFRNYNPYVYILFILVFPTQHNRYYLLASSFLLGFAIDFCLNTGGLYSFSAVFLAFFRRPIMNLVYNKAEFDYNKFYFEEFNIVQRFIYLVSCILVHHIALFFLVNFKFNNYDFVIINTMYSTGLTLTIVFIYFGLFMTNKRDL